MPSLSRRTANLRAFAGAFLAGLGLAPAPAAAQGSPFSFTKKVEVDRGTYYRLTVELAYKGAPLTLDVVVGCNARITTYKDNDRSYEVGIAPMVYGLKMPDGAGVIVRPPNACGGETTQNGKVPENLMPLVMTVEDADRPWFAVGYGQEEAYSSPLSVLSFTRATITKASRAEYDAWRREKAPLNIVKPEMLDFKMGAPFDKRTWHPGRRYFPGTCFWVTRAALPEPMRDAIRPFRPAGEPRYWFSDEAWAEVRRLAGSYYGQRRGVLFNGRHLWELSINNNISEGLARPGGGGTWGKAKVAGESYPERIGWSLNDLGPDGKLPIEPAYAPALVMGEAEVRPEKRGFMYCYATHSNELNHPARFDRSVPGIVLVSGEVVANDKEGGQRTAVPGRASYSTYDYFEADTHVMMKSTVGLYNIFGGL